MIPAASHNNNQLLRQKHQPVSHLLTKHGENNKNFVTPKTWRLQWRWYITCKKDQRSARPWTPIHPSFTLPMQIISLQPDTYHDLLLLPYVFNCFTHQNSHKYNLTNSLFLMQSHAPVRLCEKSMCSLFSNDLYRTYIIFK